MNIRFDRDTILLAQPILSKPAYLELTQQFFEEIQMLPRNM